MEECSAEEMPDIIIPPVEVNMVVDEDRVVVHNGDNIKICNDYKKEMLESGLESSDMEYLDAAYKNLEDVKFIRIHCTSCDTHIGSAPNDLQNRYEHPLLKVLICGYCFQFYSSGDFEKDEDGSELYCRWCGEGGQVFCCTKCPFVFCKKCIKRNLGKGIAKVIENSDNWMCFSCDTSQISRHRATYWAVQKYSEEMIKRAKITGNTEKLSVDDNICCSAFKKRSEVYDQLVQPPKKRQKMVTVSTLQAALERIKPSTSTQAQYHNKMEGWQPSCIIEQPEDEVICTPDIIPMDESPVGSPVRVESPSPPPPPPPMMPPVQHNVPVPMPVVTQVRPLLMRSPVPTNICLTDLQRHLQQKYTQIILTPRAQIKPPVVNNQAVLIRKQTPLLPKTAPQNNGNYRFVINSTPSMSVPTAANNTSCVTGSVNRIKTHALTPVATTSKVQETNNKDWFDQAVVDCAEVTEYISTKISSLSGVHTRAYKSEKLMEELHNTFQTYMHVTIEKINKIRRVMQSNFEKDIENHFKSEKIVNPFAIKKLNKPESTSDENSTWEDSNSNESFKTSKTRYVLTKNIEPDEVLFDMDVTNASDEENHSSETTLLNEEYKKDAVNDSDDDIQEVEYKKNTEVIHIIDSDDEMKEDNTESNIISNDILEKIRAKFNITNIPSKELIKYLSAVIIVTNKINKEIQELSNSKISVYTGEIQRNIESKLITGIQNLLEDSIIGETNIKESVVNMGTEYGETVENKNYQIENNNCEVKNNSEEYDPTESDNTTQRDENNLSKNNSEVTSQRNAHDDNNMLNDIQDKDLCDIEEILDSNVVLRANKNTTSFGDEFSKFVCGKVEEYPADVADDMSDSLKLEEYPAAVADDMADSLKVEEYPADVADNMSDSLKVKEYPADVANDMSDSLKVKEYPADDMSDNLKVKEYPADLVDNMSDSLKDTINIARELDIIPEYVNDICNRDNGSLSLPPDSITEFSASEMEMLMKHKVRDEKECDVINKESNNSDIVLNSEILALKQMAENCVNSVDHKTSTECKG